VAKPTETTVEEEAPSYLVDRLSESRPSALAEAARKAVLWVQSRYRTCGKEAVDWDDPIVEEAGLKRSLYELHALQETEDVPQDKKEDATDLMVAVLGGCAEGDDAASVVVEEGEQPAWMEGFEGRKAPRRDGKRRVP